MDEIVSAFVKGGKEVRAELDAMQISVDKATASALKKVTAKTKSSIKSRMRGRPRWDHRGASDRTGETVSLGLSPHHSNRSGGPGKLTGKLNRSIRASRKPRKTGASQSSVVFAGGKGGPQNLYKGKVEEKYPYFEPGVKSAEPKLPAIWEAEWAKATQTKK